MERTICIDGKTIPYTLERKRVKNINLRVRRDGSVFVSASPLVPLRVIERFLLSRGAFLLRAAEKSAQAAEQSWTEGRRLYYLGRPLTLSLVRGTRSSVSVEDGRLCVSLRSPEEPESVRRAVLSWYRAESERLCREACARLYPFFASCGVARPQLRMRSMRSCWGNCRPERGVVTFNSLLAAADRDCVEYVVAHELTHFLHADHSRAFYASLARVIPDWKARRARLKSLAELLFS